MTMVMAMVDGLRMDAAGGGHHRAGQRNAHQGDDQFLVHGVVPFSFGCLGLACDQSADNAADDTCAEFDPAVVIVVAVVALVAVVTVARGSRATSGLVASDVMLRSRVARRSLRLLLVVDRRRLAGLDGLVGFVTRRLDHRGLALGRRTVPVLRRRHRAAAERQARQTRDHHLLDHLLHNAPHLSLSSFRA